MNPQRWRFLALVAALYSGSLALAVPLYLKTPADKKPVMLGLGLVLLCAGLVGVGINVALWRRFPVRDENDKID